MSILPPLSKVNEQESNYFHTFFNEILCGSRKIHSTQYVLFKILSSWQNLLNRGGFVGSIAIDLSTEY